MNDTRLCQSICSSIYRVCHSRKSKVFCKKFKEEKRRIHKDSLLRAEMSMISKMSVNLIGEDTFDSIGNDISSSEFLENEIFFETQ